MENMSSVLSMRKKSGAGDFEGCRVVNLLTDWATARTRYVIVYIDGSTKVTIAADRRKLQKMKMSVNRSR
jgi:hypothetical protein